MANEHVCATRCLAWYRTVPFHPWPLSCIHYFLVGADDDDEDEDGGRRGRGDDENDDNDNDDDDYERLQQREPPLSLARAHGFVLPVRLFSAPTPRF